MPETYKSAGDPPAGFSLNTLLDRVSGGNKAIRFAVWGAAGCVVGAILGEILLAATRVASPSQPAREVCLLIDCSDSMRGFDERGTKLDEVKSAAIQFTERQDLGRDSIAVVGFGTNTNVVAQLGDQAPRLRSAIASLNFAGGTAIDSGLDAAALQFSLVKNSEAPAKKFILLFTDGVPNDEARALASAARCRENQIQIVAIGTGDADNKFLAEVTADPKLVFSAQSGSFGETFQQAEKAIYGGSLVESSPTQSGFVRSLLQIIGWSALLAAGGAIALIAGQNLYLGRPAFSGKELLIGLTGGVVAGVIAGAIGQLFFSIAVGTSDSSTGNGMLTFMVTTLGRVIGWALLGALIGRGMAIFVPNLQARLALVGGAIGGAVAAVAFIFVAPVGDLPGRLLGAAILGACIGLMIVAFETAFRQFWLEIRRGTRETVRVTLGPTVVKIGSDSGACSVYARGARPLEVGYLLDDGKVQCIDYATERRAQVKPGDERSVGNVTVVVCGAAAAATPQAGANTTTRPPVPPAPPKAKSDSKGQAPSSVSLPSGGDLEKGVGRKAPPPPPTKKPR